MYTFKTVDQTAIQVVYVYLYQNILYSTFRLQLSTKTFLAQPKVLTSTKHLTFTKSICSKQFAIRLQILPALARAQKFIHVHMC